MTTYEHAMLGLTLAVAAGTQRRYGWALPATAAVAATVPDWDAVSLLLGPAAYATGHRTWGHNLFAAGLLGGVVGAVGYLCYLSAGVRERALALLRRLGEEAPAAGVPPRFTGHGLALWVVVGVLAGLSHLPADILYPWRVPLLWPLAGGEWQLDVLKFGDLVPTILFLGGMFGMALWRRRARLIAWLTLLAVGCYVGVRWATS